MNGAVEADGSRDYRTAIIDASIVAGMTLFSTLMTALVTVTEFNDIIPCLLRSGIASGFAFFSTLTVSLNIKKPES